MAFTLVELMISVAILFILAALAIPRYQQARSSALISALVGELVGFARACAMVNASGLSETPSPLPVSPERGGVEILQGCTAENQGATLQATWGSARTSGIACMTSRSSSSSSKAIITITPDNRLSCVFED